MRRRRYEEEMTDTNVVVVMLYVSGLSREECKKLKAKRRTLKNRGYAASCRHKRDNEEGDLQGEKMELEVTLLGSLSQWNLVRIWSCLCPLNCWVLLSLLILI